jgi:hypothetical protein
MSIHRLRPVSSALALAVSVIAVQILHAEAAQHGQPTGGNFTMRKQVIGAGEVSMAGSYRLTGTVGEVGASESSTPRFQLIGGFHGPAGALIDPIFCDGFELASCP